MMIAREVPFEYSDGVGPAAIQEGTFPWPQSMDDELRSLIGYMLDPNPITRWTIEQIKQHAWYRRPLMSQDDLALRMADHMQNSWVEQKKHELVKLLQSPVQPPRGLLEASGDAQQAPATGGAAAAAAAAAAAVDIVGGFSLLPPAAVVSQAVRNLSFDAVNGLATIDSPRLNPDGEDEPDTDTARGELTPRPEPAAAAATGAAAASIATAGGTAADVPPMTVGTGGEERFSLQGASVMAGNSGMDATGMDDDGVGLRHMDQLKEAAAGPVVAPPAVKAAARDPHTTFRTRGLSSLDDSDSDNVSTRNPHHRLISRDVSERLLVFSER